MRLTVQRQPLRTGRTSGFPPQIPGLVPRTRSTHRAAPPRRLSLSGASTKQNLLLLREKYDLHRSTTNESAGSILWLRRANKRDEFRHAPPIPPPSPMQEIPQTSTSLRKSRGLSWRATCADRSPPQVPAHSARRRTPTSL